MAVIPFDEGPHKSVWRRLAEALDAYFINRTLRAVPDVTLQRARQEIARCRRLMHQSAALPVAAAGVSKTQRRADHLRT